MSLPPSDYHDYVIKDGQFVGAFEEMYRQCEDPWLQCGNPAFAHQLVLHWLRDQRPRNVLDFGCGLGAFTRRLGEVAGAVTAVDLSPTACVRARGHAAGARFAVMDARALGLRPASHDVVVVSELLWYVLPDVQSVLSALLELARPGGWLIVVQQFYREGTQQYGAEVMSTPLDLVQLLPVDPAEVLVLEPHLNPKCVVFMRRPE